MRWVTWRAMSARPYPLARRCEEEKLIKPGALPPDRRALFQCLNSIEGCKEPLKAAAAAAALKGVQTLKRKVPCYVVSDACGKGSPALSSQPETGMHLSGKIPPAKSDLPRHATCALVGNGPGLRLEGMGEIIDRHDAVYRFNAYNLGQREGKMQARPGVIHLTSVWSSHLMTRDHSMWYFYHRRCSVRYRAFHAG